jgi:hypothetical protein
MRTITFKSVLTACALVLGGASLTACVTPIPANLPLATGARDAITSTEVVAPIAQNEIYVYVVPSTAGAAVGGGFGIVGALAGVAIDASVNAANTKAAEGDVKPARDAIVDYNFDGVLTADLQKSLSEVGFLKVQGVRATKDIAQVSLDNSVTNSSAGVVLMTIAKYEFNGDATSLTITMTADLYAKDPALAGYKPTKTANAKLVAYPGNSIYRNTFTYAQPLAGATTKRDENIAKWSADKGKAIRDALDAGSAAVASKLAEDIQRAPPPPAAKKKK